MSYITARRTIHIETGEIVGIYVYLAAPYVILVLASPFGPSPKTQTLRHDTESGIAPPLHSAETFIKWLKHELKLCTLNPNQMLASRRASRHSFTTKPFCSSKRYSRYRPSIRSMFSTNDNHSQPVMSSSPFLLKLVEEGLVHIV